MTKRSRKKKSKRSRATFNRRKYNTYRGCKILLEKLYQDEKAEFGQGGVEWGVDEVIRKLDKDFGG